MSSLSCQKVPSLKMKKGIVTVTETGEVRHASDVLDADYLLDMKKELSGTEHNGIWQVIGEVIKVWVNKHQNVWKSYLVELGTVKETRADKEFGKSKDTMKYHGDRGNIRYTIDMPEPIYNMIRCIYNDEELPMNREFFQEFGKRFKTFRVAEKQ